MRRSGRRPPQAPVPHRIKCLFHNNDTDQLQLPSKRFELLHRDPNVFLVRDFLTAAELDYFDALCSSYSNRFRSSFTEAEDASEIVSEERTSRHIHLIKAQDRFVRCIEQRAGDMVGLSPQNCEPLQIVSYTAGQKFDLHHDAGTLCVDTDCSVDEEQHLDLDQQKHRVEIIHPRRLVTFFVYLNNLPENEGVTEFPALRCSNDRNETLKIQPRRGYAVLFCNVLPDGAADIRTVHCAQPVAEGLVKYGVNIWITDISLHELSQVKPTFTLTDVTARKTDQKRPRSALSRAEQLTDQFICNARRKSVATQQQEVDNEVNCKRYRFDEHSVQLYWPEHDS